MACQVSQNMAKEAPYSTCRLLLLDQQRNVLFWAQCFFLSLTKQTRNLSQWNTWTVVEVKFVKFSSSSLIGRTHTVEPKIQWRHFFADLTRNNLFIHVKIFFSQRNIFYLQDVYSILHMLKIDIWFYSRLLIGCFNK